MNEDAVTWFEQNTKEVANKVNLMLENFGDPTKYFALGYAFATKVNPNNEDLSGVLSMVDAYQNTVIDHTQFRFLMKLVLTNLQNYKHLALRLESSSLAALGYLDASLRQALEIWKTELRH